jgi:hypothetical protein
MSASDWVPCGASAQVKAGETSAASQVYRFGIVPPSGKDALFTTKAME